MLTKLYQEAITLKEIPAYSDRITGTEIIFDSLNIQNMHIQEKYLPVL